MLPEELSTGTTSLLEVDGKLSVVTEFVVDQNGQCGRHQIYRALVVNRAQLTYNAVGAWLEGRGPAPAKVAASAELQAQLKLQDEAAQALRNERHRHGALNIETAEVRPVVLNEQIVDLQKQEKNRATELIEDFMIAANGVVARTLEEASIHPSGAWSRRRNDGTASWHLRRSRAASFPPSPIHSALNDFLQSRKAADPDHFADLSWPWSSSWDRASTSWSGPATSPGHFGLAVQDYTHSTAPNRRFADIVTQRLIKSLLAGGKCPYTEDELSAIARNCTLKENAARKVERAMYKRIAAVGHPATDRTDVPTRSSPASLPQARLSALLQPHVEGLLVHGDRPRRGRQAEGQADQRRSSSRVYRLHQSVAPRKSAASPALARDPRVQPIYFVPIVAFNLHFSIFFGAVLTLINNKQMAQPAENRGYRPGSKQETTNVRVILAHRVRK